MGLVGFASQDENCHGSTHPHLQEGFGERGPSILSRSFTAFSDVGYRRALLVERHEERVAELYERAKRVLAAREARIELGLRERLRTARVKYGRSLRLFDRLPEASRARLKTAWGEAGEARREVTASAKLAEAKVRELKLVASPAEGAKQAFGKRRGAKKNKGGDGGVEPTKPRRPRR